LHCQKYFKIRSHYKGVQVVPHFINKANSILKNSSTSHAYALERGASNQFKQDAGNSDDQQFLPKYK